MRGLRDRTITSPFLNELPESHLKVTDRTGLPRDEALINSFEREREQSMERRLAGFRRGQMVRHPTFGIGRIADLSESGTNTRAVVEFTSAGRKTLILEHARLEAVG